MNIPDATLWTLAGVALVFAYSRIQKAGRGNRSRGIGGGVLIAAAILVVFLVFEVPLLILFVAVLLYAMTSGRFIKSIDAWQKPSPYRRKGTR